MNPNEKWSLGLNRLPDAVRFRFEQEILRAEETAEGRYTAPGTELSAEQDGKGIVLTLRACARPISHIFLRWKTAIPEGVRVFGDAWERGYGDMEWRAMVPERVLPWYFLMTSGSSTCGAGVTVRPNALCFWQTDAGGITLTLDVRCGGTGFEPKGEVLLCRIVSTEPEEGENTFAAARRLVSALCPEEMRRLPKTPVYGGNNWYYAYGKSTAEEFLADAARVAEWSQGLSNRPFMVMDDGWQVRHFASCNGGPWNRGNAAFPDMPALAEGVRRQGVRPGIWLRPLLTQDPLQEEWRLKRDIPEADRNGGWVMDPSLPEVQRKITEDFARLEKWGFELIKQDFTTFDLLGRWGFAFGADLTQGGWHFADRSKTTAMVIRDLYDAMRRGVSDETLLMGCNTMPHLSAGVFELSRTGDDTSGRVWERTRRMGPNTLAFRMPEHDILQACDADCVGLTRQIPWEMNRQWLDVLSRSGTPLFVSAAPDALGERERQALREAFARASVPRTPAEPLDWTETTCPRKWKTEEGIFTYDWEEDFGAEPLNG